MDINTNWRVSAEKTLDMERKFALSQPRSITVVAVYVERGAITAVVDKGKVCLEDGILEPSDLEPLELTQSTSERTARIMAAAICTCPLTHEQVVAGEGVNMKITPVDLSKAVTVRRVLPKFAPLLSVYVFINTKDRVRTRKMHMRHRLRASRRARSGLKQ